MAIRTNTNPRPLSLPPELQDILLRNGMQAQVVGSSNGFALIVQGHDSPALTYPITEKQLKALTDWGTNTANRRAYTTFASIIAADFDMPKDFVHARNANGRVAMGLHGYRIGVGEYGRHAPRPYPNYGFHGPNPYRHMYHMIGPGFLGWTPRQQEGWHMRRIGGNVYYPGAPMVPTRSDGRMKPGELAAGGYGFYYKQTATAQPAQVDVLADLQTVIRPNLPQRPSEPAIPYKTHITSDVYFSVAKWDEVLKSHGIIVDPETKKLTIQSSSVEADLQYDLTDDELKVIMSDSLKDHPIADRLKTINGVISSDFKEGVTMDMLNSDKLIDIHLHDEVQQDLDRQLHQQEEQYRQVYEQVNVQPEELPKGTVLMDGNDLAYINPDKGWFREGRHGREVVVDDIRVEPTEEGKYKMTAVIDGETISHEIKQKDYDKFLAVDDFHRMKMFSKIFKEVDMKDRYPVGLGTKILAGLSAGLVVAGELTRPHHPGPDIYMAPPPHVPVYFKPGVDTPADVAAREYDAMVNNPHIPRGPGMGM